MTDLKGYVAFDFNKGVPYASITPNGITFNRGCTVRLNYTEYAQLFIDYGAKKIALVACEQGDKYAERYFKERANGVLSVRWNHNDLLSTIAQITGWKLKDEAYRAFGTFEPKQEAIIFDLNKAVQLK